MKRLPLLVVGLLLLISWSQSASDFYIIEGQYDGYEGDIFLIRALHSDYYLDAFEEEQAIVSNGKFQFSLSKENKYPLPFFIRSGNSMSSGFIMESRDQELFLKEVNRMSKPRIECVNSTVHKEDLLLYERRKASIDSITSSIDRIHSSGFSNDSIQKLIEIERAIYNERTELIIKSFAEDYPASYVSFWYLVFSIEHQGYSPGIDEAYQNLSPEIRASEVAAVFEQRMLVAKMSQTGNYFPEFETK
ncbi:hypothetical protein [Lutimonas sp.]|uniref:hypothetical protein n=1 Tax=Lutimonas sp. TaxID=1872403 RepID=UPI003D9AC007